jgi:hypothetical protein
MSMDDETPALSADDVRKIVREEVARLLPSLLEQYERDAQLKRDSHARSQGFSSYAEMQRRSQR